MEKNHEGVKKSVSVSGDFEWKVENHTCKRSSLVSDMTSGLETGVTGFSGTFKWSCGLDIIGRLFLSYMVLIDRLLVSNAVFIAF